LEIADWKNLKFEIEMRGWGGEDGFSRLVEKNGFV